MPFDKLKAQSKAEGLRLPAYRQAGVDTALRLTQCSEPVEGSGAFAPVLKAGVWRRRSIKSKPIGQDETLPAKLKN